MKYHQEQHTKSQPLMNFVPNQRISHQKQENHR